MDSQRMKDSYTIGEISRLFGIGVDSLRYYERLGVITPRRAPNGYRLYRLADVYRLACIKELRGFGLGMDEIKRYLDTQSIDSTEALVARELDEIDRQMRALAQQRHALHARLERIEQAQSARFGTLTAYTAAARRCIQVSGRIERDEEMDLLISRLHRRHEEQLPQLSTMKIGAFFDREALDAGRCDVFSSVFFIVDDAGIPSDFELPAGRYLAYRYRGSYAQDERAIHALAGYFDDAVPPASAAPFEIYEIDNRDTACEDEFVTRVEVRL